MKLREVKNMKNNLIFLMVFLAITIVSAITVGSILTQEDLNKQKLNYKFFDASFEENSKGINITHCRDDADVCYAKLIISKNIEPNYITDIEDQTIQNGYIIVTKEYEIPFRTTKYYDIAQNSTLKDAWTILESDLILRAESQLDSEIRRIESYSTKELKEKEQKIYDIVNGKKIKGIA